MSAYAADNAVGAKTSCRMNYAIDRLQAAMDEADVEAGISAENISADINLLVTEDNLKPQYFSIIRENAGGPLCIRGGDESGLLYGCLELANMVRKLGKLPEIIDYIDGPEMRLRGTCIAMQQTHGGYLWPYTPKNFPFFYDQELWSRYLDMLVNLRYNCLFLWNGHPFSSLVTLEDYPEAAEVSPEIMSRNCAMMYWLTNECDKRGIWLVQMFYNIHLPESLGLGTHLNRSEPKAADYTRKSIAKFVEEYPNVGLLVCLGEALSGKENMVQWLTETIIPGVRQGLKARGWTEEDLMNKEKLPPLGIRGHHVVDQGAHEAVLGKAMELYPNIVTMVKYSGEGLTTRVPRGTYAQYHRDMAAFSQTHMVNVHLLSNLEPFRYAGFSFIWDSVKAIRDRLDGNGLHLYPLAYWDWPNTPDKADLLQLERDRLWFEIWARYCWRIDRNPTEEKEYWIGKLENQYGTQAAAEKIYVAYNASGECAPRLCARFAITAGNRQCTSLGMRLDQMVHREQYRPWRHHFSSDAPPGESIKEYVERELAGLEHNGETPVDVNRDTMEFSQQAVEAIEAAVKHVTKNQEEFARLRNDIHCIRALTEHYVYQARAAMEVVRHEMTQNQEYLQAALPYAEKAVDAFQRLTKLAGPAYRYAPSLNDKPLIPKPKTWHWDQMLPVYKQDLADFKRKVAGQSEVKDWRADRDKIKPWLAANFKLLTKEVETYEIKKGARVFTDRDYAIKDIVPQLVGLTGMRFSHSKAMKGGDIRIDFEVVEPVKVLVGYFDSSKKEWLQVPMLEHVAHADDRGGLDIILENVADIGDAERNLPHVNVHAFKYGKGRNTLEMIGKGSYIVLGVIPAKTDLSKSVNAESADED